MEDPNMSVIDRSRWGIFAIVLVVAACTTGAPSPPSAPATGDASPTASSLASGTIKIGLPTAFTGPITVPGTSMLAATEIALNDLNDQGGLIVGGTQYQLELVNADDKCSPEEGVAALEQLLTVAEVQFLVGGLCSSAVLASMSAANQSQVPYLITSAGADSIYQTIAKDQLKYLFHFGPTTFSLATSEAAAMLYHLKPRSVAILVEDTAAGHDADRYFTEYLQANAPTVVIVSHDTIAQNAQTMLPVLTRIKSQSPDVLYTLFSGVNNETLVQQKTEVGLEIMHVAGGGNDFARPDFVAKHADNIEHTLVDVRWSPALKTERTDAFLSTFRAKAGRDADNFALQQYDALLVLFDALQRAGSTDPDAVVAALEATDLTGVWSPHKISPLADGHRSTWDLVIAQIQGGDFVPVWPQDVIDKPVTFPPFYQPGG
jgi:branched-chain amino acid transport system substrate-binding protein